MTDFDKIDSKYRFVIIASKRAKELLKGAKARTKSKAKNLVRIAQQEVEMGLVDFEILKGKAEDASDQEERIFLGEETAVEIEAEGAAGAETEIFGEEAEAGGEAEEAEEEGPEEEEEEKADSSKDSTEENEDEGESAEEED